MKHFNRFFATFLVALLLVSLFACAPKLTASAVTPTQEPVQTAAPTATPTAMPVPTVTPVPTLSLEEEKEILNQQFQYFLNKEGEFTEEKMNRLPVYASERDPGDGTILGILRVFDPKDDDYYVSVYGYLFDVIKDENNNIFLVMGFDGKNGNRFITTLRINGSTYDYYHNLEDSNKEKDALAFWFATEEGLHIDDDKVPQFRASSSEQIANYIEGLKDKKIVAAISARYFKLDDTYTGGSRTWWEVSNENLSSTKCFINSLATNGVNTDAVEPSSGKLNLIDSSDDLDTIDFKNTPQVTAISYRKNG